MERNNDGELWKGIMCVFLCVCLGLAAEINTTIYDTTEDYNSHAVIVRALDHDVDVGLLLLFDADPVVLTMKQLLNTSKPLITWGENVAHQQHTDRPYVYLEPDLCGDEIDKLLLNDDPDCEMDVNVTSSVNDSTGDNSVTVTGPVVMARLVQELAWSMVVIIHENATEHESTHLVDRLSEDGVLFVIFNLDLVADVHAFLNDVYTHRDVNNPEINFAVLCSYSCARRIFRAANNFDFRHIESKTILKQLSRWLVAVYGHTHGVSRVLQACAQDLDNVVIIALPEYSGAGSDDFEQILDDVMLDIFRRQTTDPQNITLVDDLVERISEKAVSWSPSKVCKGFKIETLLWKATGRGFSTVGYVEMSGRVVVLSDLFPNTNYGYNKQKFLISTLEYNPFVYKKLENGTAVYEGFCMDILRELARKLNFTYELTEPEDQNWGTLTDSVNITFNGLIGQVQREVVDMVMAPISVQPTRDLVVDFTHPFFYDYTTVITKKPDPKLRKWRTLIDPFKPEVLASIGVALPVMTLIVFLIEKYNPFYDDPENAEERRRNGGLNSIVDAFWYMYGALLCQGGVHLPSSVAGRTFISCWCLFSIIIVGTYCGNLIAFLTVTKDKPLFSTLEEMVNMGGDFKWGTLGGTSWETVFMTSNKSEFRNIGDGLIRFNKTDPGVLNKDPNYHLQRIKEGNGQYAWIGDKTYIELAMATECGLLKIKEEFLPLKYAIALPNNSPHTKIFSDQLMQIRESGLMQLWKRRWWPKSNFCGGDMALEAKPITLVDVQSAFYVCLIGVVLGTIAFICELTIFHCTAYWRRKHPKLANNVIIYNTTGSSRMSISVPGQTQEAPEDIPTRSNQNEAPPTGRRTDMLRTGTPHENGTCQNGFEKIRLRKNQHDTSVDKNRLHARVYY